MRFEITFKDKKAIAAIDKRMKKVFADRDKMFVKTMGAFLIKVERNVIKDTFNEPYFSHDFKGSVRKSIAARVSHASLTSNSMDVEIEAGIFNPHGMNLEVGSPAGTDIPFHRMLAWVRKKFGRRPDEVEIAKRIKKKILLKGALAWPIVGPSWEVTKDQYYKHVVAQFRARF